MIIMRNIITTVFITFIWSSFIYSQSNDCATATPITFTNGSACVNGTTELATSDLMLYGACNTASLNEVWYTFTAEGANNDFVINSLGISNAQIVIYTGGCNVLLQTCDNTTGTGSLNVSWGFAPGQQVWIGVMSNEGLEGAFELCIDSYAPSSAGGNTCSGAIPICEIGTTTTIDFNDMNSSGTQPSCFAEGFPFVVQQTVNDDVWFQFTVTQAGTIEWTATPAAGTELDWALYDISSGCPGTEVACNYNFAGGGRFACRNE